MENGVELEKDDLTPSVMLAKSNLILIGIGNVGANALKATVKQYDPSENPCLSLLAIESNKPVLESCFEVLEDEDQGYLEKWLTGGRFQKIQLGEKGLGAGGDIEQGDLMAKAKLEDFIKIVTPFDHALLIGGGGGGSVGSMPVFAEAVRNLGKTAYAILTMPRAKEGQKKARKAQVISDRMMKICPTTHIQNERIPNKELKHSQVYQEINEHSLFWILWLLKSMLQDRGNVVDLDGNDWQAGTSTGNYTVPGFFDASEGFDNLEKELLCNPYLEARNIEKATWVAFWCKGEWTVAESDLVDECVRKVMRNGGCDEEVEFKWGIQEKGVPKGTKTVGFIAFAKEGPDTPEEKPIVAISSALTTDKPTLSIVHGSATDGNYLSSEFSHPSMTRRAISETNGHKKSFFGLINGERVPSEASEELVSQYHALFATNPSVELYRLAKETQRRLEEETGLVFDVPIKHSQVQ